MTIEDLQASIKSGIGEELFRRACLDAWERAPGTGIHHHRSRNTHAMARTFAEFEEQIARHTWSEESDLEVVSFFCSFYQEMPCYYFPAELLITRPYVDWSTEARAYFWDFARTMLSSEHDALGDPISYVLWCDFFESDKVLEAWQALTAGDPKPKLVERVLEASGPVPFSLKEALYSKLINDPLWHHPIFRSIYFSIFDVYGQVEKRKAARILARLTLPAEDDAEAQRAWAALSGARNTKHQALR